MMQADIQKAYDIVDWKALECILNEIGFPYQFTKWNMFDIFSVSYRFNINGEFYEIMMEKEG